LKLISDGSTRTVKKINVEVITMENLIVTADTRTPSIEFNWADGKFAIRGESYPEDVRKFYDPPVKAFRAWVESSGMQPIEFELAFVYFNSSTAKVLMDLFELLEEIAGDGRSVSIAWVHAEDDDNLKELGEEFGEELSSAKFELRVMA
jgi:hypothetical protein